MGSSWNNSTWSCELDPQGNSTDDNQSNNTSTGNSTNDPQTNSTVGENSTDGNQSDNSSGSSSAGDGQTNNSSKGPKCSKYGPSYKTTRFTIRTQVAASISIIICFSIAFLTGTTTQGAWAMIHYLQLVLILPLVTISMNEKVKDFIVSNAYTALSVYPLSL